MENIDTRFTNGKQQSFQVKSNPVPGTKFQNRIPNEDVSFRDFLKSNLKRPHVSQEFIQSIKDKIKLA